MSNICVIGIGNRWRGDDGVGPAVLEHLRGRVSPQVRLIDSDGEPTRLLATWSQAEQAVVVDAVATDTLPPGRIRRLDRAELAQARGGSSHAMPLRSAVDLAAALNQHPRRLVIYAVVGARFEPGQELSPAVAEAVPVLAEEIVELLAGTVPAN